MTVPADGRPDATSVLLPGPWSHRSISANGIGLHVAEAGEGPLVLLLHGFPQFWWTWRAQLTALAAAGFHAVAPDLRGYGASDKPPRGYDLPTLSADVAALLGLIGKRLIKKIEKPERTLETLRDLPEIAHREAPGERRRSVPEVSNGKVQLRGNESYKV